MNYVNLDKKLPNVRASPDTPQLPAPSHDTTATHPTSPDKAGHRSQPVPPRTRWKLSQKYAALRSVSGAGSLSVVQSQQRLGGVWPMKSEVFNRRPIRLIGSRFLPIMNTYTFTDIEPSWILFLSNLKLSMSGLWICYKGQLIYYVARFR